MAAKTKKVMAANGVLTADAADKVQIKVLDMAAGGDLVVEVEVVNPSADYTVTFGRTGTGSPILMFSRVNRRETIKNLQAGQYVLGWHFEHFAKGWAHAISATTPTQKETLESRSEANMDSPRSIGFALVVVS